MAAVAEDMNDKKDQDMKLDHHGMRGNKRERDNREGRNHRQDNRGRGGEREHGNYPPRRNRNPNREHMASASGPTNDLQMREGGPKKFTGRSRLFIGNLPSSITDDDFRNLFTPFGEVAEVFLNASRGFGFVKLDTKQNAEAAKSALDFSVKDGKALRVRFATHGAALKVKNLSEWVSNELLEAAFSIFGDVERAVVIVDDRGKSVGEGIVEYSRKQAAQTALRRCTDGCLLLTSSPRPVLVELLEQRDEEDGLPEKNFQKNNMQFMKERDIGPRLAEHGTFEYEYAMRWKKLYEVEKQKRNILEKEIVEARYQLEEQMEYSLYEHEASLLREKLCHMEEQSSMLQREREMRLEENRRREEQRRQEELRIRQQQEEILRRRGMEDNFRWQEDNLMMQANSLSGMLDRQEAALRQMQGSGPQNISERMGGSSPNVADGLTANSGMAGRGIGIPPPPRPFQFDQPPPSFIPSTQNNPGMDRDQRDEFSGENKRRRY